MTYVIICYFKTERSWTVEICFSATSHPKGCESSDLRDGTIKVWNTLLVLFWFGILAEFCSKHEEDCLTIWFFVEGVLSLCQSWTSVFLFILIHFTWAMMMLDYFQPGSCWVEVSDSYQNLGSLVTELSVEAIIF